MRRLLDNENYTVILFEDLVYIKISGFQTEEDSEILMDALDLFTDVHKGKEISVYCDFSDIILSEYNTALKINKKVQFLSEQLKVNRFALVFINSYKSYKHHYATHSYFVNVNFPIKAFTDKEKALNWLEEVNSNVNQLANFLR